MNFSIKQNLWELARHLWTKYVSLSDEYKMLRDKWIFLSGELNPALPDLRSRNNKTKLTFDILDRQIADMDDSFLKDFNLSRNKVDDIGRFRRGTIQQYSDLEEQVTNLSIYVGLMKLAFYQRTTSIEVPHVTVGWPHSPERTVGNELVYVAADKVAEAYVKCLNPLKKLPKWDGFITYIPPIAQEFSTGAFCEVTSCNLVRLVLSEINKNAISPYLILAHEVGHIPLFVPKKGGAMKEEYIELAQSMIRKIPCMKCTFGKQNLSAGENESDWVLLIIQLFADIFGVKIGGPTTIEALLNEYLFSPYEKRCPKYIPKNMLIRFWATVAYMQRTGFPERARVIESRLKKTAQQHFHDERENKDYPCFGCLQRLGENIGEKIYEEECRDSEIFSKFLREERVFKITDNEEEEMKRILTNNHICPDKDPRKILHSYFLASQEASVFKTKDKKHPSFASTLHSLAYNTYNRKQKQ